MSTVWDPDLFDDPWETLPPRRTAWAIGPRSGRRFLFHEESDASDTALLDTAIEATRGMVRLEGWNSIGAVILDENDAELMYRSLNA